MVSAYHLPPCQVPPSWLFVDMTSYHGVPLFVPILAQQSSFLAQPNILADH